MQERVIHKAYTIHNLNFRYSITNICVWYSTYNIFYFLNQISEIEPGPKWTSGTFKKKQHRVYLVANLFLMLCCTILVFQCCFGFFFTQANDSKTVVPRPHMPTAFVPVVSKARMSIIMICGENRNRWVLERSFIKEERKKCSFQRGISLFLLLHSYIIQPIRIS